MRCLDGSFFLLSIFLSSLPSLFDASIFFPFIRSVLPSSFFFISLKEKRFSLLLLVASHGRVPWICCLRQSTWYFSLGAHHTLKLTAKTRQSTKRRRELKNSTATTRNIRLKRWYNAVITLAHTCIVPLNTHRGWIGCSKQTNPQLMALQYEQEGLLHFRILYKSTFKTQSCRWKR